MRHSWVWLREHHYICRLCGCGKVNFQDARNNWAQKYHLPTGEAKVLRHTPPCEVGPKSQAYIARYAREIADDAEVKLAERAARKAAKSAPAAIPRGTIYLTPLSK